MAVSYETMVSFKSAIAQLIAERGLPQDLVVDTVSKALLDAYRRTSQGAADGVEISVDKNGDVHLRVQKKVVAIVENPMKEISLAEAQRLRSNTALGESVPVEAPELLDKIPVHNASQIILQRIREAEFMYLYDLYKDRVDELVLGTIIKINGDEDIIVQLDKIEGVMPTIHRVKTERYRLQQRMRFYVVELKRVNGRAPQAILSRSHINMVKRLFEQEVPEIVDGSVELKGIVREAGNRSKVAVWTRQPGIDPIGACVGVKGARINRIVAELNNEKIDIIPWDPDPAVFVANALNPAKTLSVELRMSDKTALVVVPANQLSLAIGSAGQNARLAARLTGWRIDVSKPEISEE